MNQRPKQATLDDVARAAGVHKSTVSRALKSHPSVSSATTKRVVKIAEDMGYVPNLMAQSLRMNTTKTIGILIPDLTNPIFPMFIRGAEDYLREHGYRHLIADSQSRYEDSVELFQSLQAQQISGMIFCDSRSSERDPVVYAEAADLPAVQINRANPYANYPVVTGNDRQGIIQGVRHLVELGHQRIAYIAGPEDYSTANIRIDAFEFEMKARGLSGSIFRTESLSKEAGYEITQRLLDSPNRPTAVMAMTDLVAMGSAHAAIDRGLSVPDDLSIIGHNDMPFAEDFVVPLTTVRVPLIRIGREAAKILLSAIAEGHQEATVTQFPVELIVRSSTGPAPTR